MLAQISRREMTGTSAPEGALVHEDMTARWFMLSSVSYFFIVDIIALIIAVPISLGIALFVTQVAPDRIRKPIVYLLDLLAVIPSVVFGMWGVLVLARHIKGLYGWLYRTFDGWPVLGSVFGKPQTRSFLKIGRAHV